MVRKSEGKRPLGRRTTRWEDNIRMDLKKYNGREWTQFMWLRTGTSGGLALLKTVMYLPVP
jgi:hypothetical protein